VKYSNNDDIPRNGTTATYTCIEGYIIQGSNTRVCNNTLVWTGTPPTCIEAECNSTLDVLHGSYSVNQSSYVFGDVVRYECDAGYYIDGAPVLTCDSTGTWNATLPTCQPVVCNSVILPDHASVNYTNGTTFLSQVYIQCELGFNMFGSSHLTCNETGLWEPDPPTCSAISKYLLGFRWCGIFHYH